MFKNCVWFGNDAWDNSRHIFKAVFVFNVYVGIKGRWACPICNNCVIYFIHIYIGQLFILHIVICFYIFVFLSLGNAEVVPLDSRGEYLLLTEVKFTTSGTIRYNVIKISY